DTAGVRMAKKFGCPLIIWLDAPFPIERAFRQESYFKSLHISRMRALGQQAQRIVTVSRVAKEYYSQLGLPEAKILILPNGIPERLLRKGMEFALKRRPFSQPHECVVGFVGSLSRWHGVTFLLDALRELLNFQSVQWRLQIVGYGEEYKRLCAQAHQLGVSPFVEWLGALPHEQAFERIAQFDIAVLPHTLPTGAPMKLFEYAALARPVIAPDFPNLRAWFTNDELCFIKPEDPQALADAILSLCKAPKEAQEMGLRAQARVAEYTWEKIVQRILNDVQL
ncbi:MAG: glycosyltransferase family 4 protein, partial [Candidatus Bipolaricaulaceae bacterium]